MNFESESPAASHFIHPNQGQDSSDLRECLIPKIFLCSACGCDFHAVLVFLVLRHLWRRDRRHRGGSRGGTGHPGAAGLLPCEKAPPKVRRIAGAHLPRREEGKLRLQRESLLHFLLTSYKGCGILLHLACSHPLRLAVC